SRRRSPRSPACRASRSIWRPAASSSSPPTPSTPRRSATRSTRPGTPSQQRNECTVTTSENIATPAGEDAETTRLELEIEGMTCASCANRIERKLNKLDNVSAAVNYATEKARVEVAAGIEPQLLLDTVEQAGYSARLPQPRTSEAGTTKAGATGNAGNATDDSAGVDRVEGLKQRVSISAVLSIPVIAMAMIPALQFTNWQWLSLTLAAPVVVWGAYPFHRAAWINLRHGTFTMDTLVSMGTLAALAWSLYALFF